uniref:Uncharacterized protein n=1 Tax=Magallana gigas TaxID=29159 RepID=A0A8W8K4V9_MAGGI
MGKDYNTNILDELALEGEKAPVIRNADDDDEPFKKLLSELNNDIGEISESSKRNAGRSSGVQPKGPVLTTRSTTITNSSIKPISTQRPIPVSTGAKPNLQTPTPLPNVNKNKTQEKIVEAKQQKPSGNNHHMNKVKMADKANGKMKLPQKPPLRTPNQNPSRTVANTHPKKSGNQNKLPTNQTGKNANNNSSPTKSANSKTQENQISKGNGRKPIDKHKKLRLEKKMVVGEIRGLLAYLKQMKDHLSRPINNNNAVKGENKNGN